LGWYLASIRVGKDGVWFCYPEYIQAELDKLFGWLNIQGHFQSLNASDFSRGAALFLSELNAIHPFREGNGRTQMSFLTLLIDSTGLPFNIIELEPKRAMNAMIESYRGDLLPLERLIFDLVRT
jgi:cell filamentation protein